MTFIDIEIDDYVSLYVAGIGSLDIRTWAVVTALVLGLAWRFGSRWYKRRKVTTLLGVVTTQNQETEYNW